MPTFHPRPNDPGAPPAPRGPTPEVAPDDAPATPDEKNVWRHSSLELEQGLDVMELPFDTLPGDVLDGSVPPRPAPD